MSPIASIRNGGSPAALRPLILGPEEKSAIASLIRHAERSVVGFETMMALSRRLFPAGGERNAPLTIEIPHGYRITFTIEEHRPEVPCRHISISIRDGGSRAASGHAVEMIMREFGFRNALQVLLRSGTVWSEAAAVGVAVNIVEPLSGNLDDLRR
jgi:hypothetical protein